MDKRKRIIIIGYFVAILFSVLIVPWKLEIYREGYSYKLDMGYFFILSPPEPIATVDYGKLLIEIVALTATLGILYFISDKLKGESIAALFYLMSDKLQRKKKDWVKKLPPYITLTGKQISQLEEIRKEINWDSDLFALAIAGRPAITKKVQYATYYKLKKQHPDWNEKKILASVLLSRLDALRKTGDMWLNTEEEFLNLIERVNTMDELCTVIISHDLDGEGKDLTGWVRGRIDRILSGSFLKPYFIDRSRLALTDLIVCTACDSEFKNTQDRSIWDIIWDRGASSAFLKFTCPKCQEERLYPLTYRARKELWKIFCFNGILIFFGVLLKYKYLGLNILGMGLIIMITLITLGVVITLIRDYLIRQRFLSEQWEYIRL